LGVAVDQIVHIGISLNIQLKLVSREIIFEVFQPVWSWYLDVTDGRTNRRSDRLWHNRALRSIAR